MTSTDSIARRSLPELIEGLHLVGDHLDAVLEVAIRRAEAEIGQQLLGEQFDVAAVGVDLGLDVRAHVAERVEVQRDELDRRIDADRAEGLARDRAEERLDEFVVRQRIDDFVEPALDARPDGAFVHVLAQALAHELDAARDVLVVELDALHRIFLAATPVALLEALRRAPRDQAEFRVVVREGVDQQPGAVDDQRVAGGGLCDGQVHRRNVPCVAQPGPDPLRGCGSARRRIRCT